MKTSTAKPAAAAIGRIERHARKIARGEYESVRPGQPFRISEAATVGDGVAQGDLDLILVAAPPADYVRLDRPSVQLVPGNTEGSRHCLDGLAGVEMWAPPGWPGVAEEMGPCLRLSEERTVLHPKHGDVTIPAGSVVLCVYQREWDAMQARSRRNAD